MGVIMSTFYVRRAIEKYEELEENKLAKKI